MKRYIRCALVVLALVSALNYAGTAAAQDRQLASLYGSGVHSYFAGQLNQAYTDLTAAINGGTKDPRAYYFRALTNMRMGQADMATADLQSVALESADVNQYYPVAKSLERVQGSTRVTLERYRSQARNEALARQRANSNNLVRSGAAAPGIVGQNVLPAPSSPALPEPARTPVAVQPVVPAGAAEDPFSGNDAEAIRTQIEADVPVGVMAEDNATTINADATSAFDAFNNNVAEPVNNNAFDAGEAVDPFGGADQQQSDAAADQQMSTEPEQGSGALDFGAAGNDAAGEGDAVQGDAAGQGDVGVQVDGAAGDQTPPDQGAGDAGDAPPDQSNNDPLGSDGAQAGANEVAEQDNNPFGND